MINTVFETNKLKLDHLNKQTLIYLQFQDYIRHFLSLMGYENLLFCKFEDGGKELSFWDKKKILASAMMKEIYRLSGKEKDDFSNYAPIINWAYSQMIGYFSFIWTEEMNAKIGYQEIQRQFLSDPSNSLNSLEENEMAERFYKILEPHVISHKYAVVRNTNNKRHTCSYCGSRYDYNKVNNCPSCGA